MPIDTRTDGPHREDLHTEARRESSKILADVLWTALSAVLVFLVVGGLGAFISSTWQYSTAGGVAFEVYLDGQASTHIGVLAILSAVCIGLIFLTRISARTMAGRSPSSDEAAIPKPDAVNLVRLCTFVARLTIVAATVCTVTLLPDLGAPERFILSADMLMLLIAIIIVVVLATILLIQASISAEAMAALNCVAIARQIERYEEALRPLELPRGSPRRRSRWAAELFHRIRSRCSKVLERSLRSAHDVWTMLVAKRSRLATTSTATLAVAVVASLSSPGSIVYGGYLVLVGSVQVLVWFGVAIYGRVVTVGRMGFMAWVVRLPLGLLLILTNLVAIEAGVPDFPITSVERGSLIWLGLFLFGFQVMVIVYLELAVRGKYGGRPWSARCVAWFLRRSGRRARKLLADGGTVSAT